MNSPKHIIDGAGLWEGRLFKFAELPSTNRWALDYIEMLRNGDVVWCNRQTAGRGRLNRTWMSPDDRGLTLSVVIIDFDRDMIPLLGQMAALAIRNVLKKYNIEASLKWPNDVLVDGKKISGILAEFDSDRNAVVLGIGLNVNLDEKDVGHYNPPVTSMRLERRMPLGIDDVRKHLLEEMEEIIDHAVRSGSAFIINTWLEHDWLKDASVDIRSHKDAVRGKYNGLDEKGRICIIDERGSEAVFWAGDVEKIHVI
jgi:BirA family biotin operon repressor/biotin-[acetyl-CoA-carboxylase] ligase